MDRESAKRILQITQDDVTEEVIKSQYRKLARIYHPDVSTLTNATEKFQELVEAQEYLLKNRQENSSRDDTTTQQTAYTDIYQATSNFQDFTFKKRQEWSKRKEEIEYNMEYNYRLWKKWEKRFIVPKFFEQSTAKIILEIILCFSVFLFIFTRGGTIGIFLRIIFSLSGGAIMLQSLVYALSVEYKLRYEKWRMLKEYYQIFQK